MKGQKYKIATLTRIGSPSNVKELHLNKKTIHLDQNSESTNI